MVSDRRSANQLVTSRKLVIFSSAEYAEEPRLFFKIAQSAANAGYDVVLIARHPRREVRGRVRIEPVHEAHSRIGRMTMSTWSAFVKALREHADIYHFSDPELLPFALLLQIITHRPVVYDLREYHSERIREKYWLPRLLRIPIARVYELMERIAVCFLGGLVAVNDDLASKGKPGKVAVVPNYPPRALFDRPLAARASLGDKYRGRRIVVFLGGITEDRGALVAIQAMKLVKQKVPDTVLLFIGPIHNPAFRTELESALRANGVEDCVEVLGPIPHENVPDYLSIADVGLCLPQRGIRRYEKSEPIKFFEYAAAGVPQVVSDLPALRRLVDEIGCGVAVDPSDPTAIAAGIVSLLQNAELARKMAENGRQAFLTQYNWDVAFARLEALYQALMQ